MALTLTSHYYKTVFPHKFIMIPALPCLSIEMHMLN